MDPRNSQKPFSAAPVSQTNTRLLGPGFTIAWPFLLARHRYVALLILSTDRGRSLRGVVTTKPGGHVVRSKSSSTVFSKTPVSGL
jgi:hypothetical protein